MQFNPSNNIVKLCLRGMDQEGKGNPDEANKIFLRAWNEATNDFEKFLAAYFVARRQNEVRDQLKWYEIALQLAKNVNDDALKAAFPALYLNIANSYEELGDNDQAKRNRDLALEHTGPPSDAGPFYHGTKADLKIGDS